MEFTEPVVTGLFTLGGVLVGGSLQAIISNVAERRREGWAARKAARLFNPRISRFTWAQAEARSDGWRWDDLCGVVESNLDDWDKYADVFAGTLEYDDWWTIYAAVRGLQQMTLTASREKIIDQRDAAYLDDLMRRSVSASMVLIGVGHYGPRMRPSRVRSAFDRVRHRLRPVDEDQALRDAGIDPAILDDDDDEPEPLMPRE